MHWLERNADRRTQSELVLPGARSIVVLAISYWVEGRASPMADAHGRIARYAWGDDYHGSSSARSFASMTPW